MKIVSVVFSLVFLSLSFSAVAQVKKVLADKIVATVGDKFILRSDIDNVLSDYKRQAQGQENVNMPSACQILEGQLIRKALVLQAEKDSILITEEEGEAVVIAILMHDIGHGPFSHTLEKTIVQGVSHEELSALFMERLNKEFKGKLSLAIKIFQDKYNIKFRIYINR